MSSDINPCRAADFFLKAIEYVDDTSITDSTCHICEDSFGFYDPPENDVQVNSLLFKALPFGGRYGHDLPNHCAVRLKNCSHVFGSECIAHWLLDNENTNCPLCREEIIYHDFFELEDPTTDDFDYPISLPDPTSAPNHEITQARQEERRRRRGIVESYTIDDLLNFDLDITEEETYKILPIDHDIVLYVCLTMFVRIPAADPSRVYWHAHLQDMTTTDEPNVYWLAGMQTILARHEDASAVFSPTNHFDNVFRVLRATLRTNIASVTNSGTLSRELLAQFETSVQEHAAEFKDKVPPVTFVENVKQAIQYFVAWWKVAGRFKAPTTEVALEDLPDLTPQSAGGSWLRQRLFVGFQKVDWNDVGQGHHEEQHETISDGDGDVETEYPELS